MLNQVKSYLIKPVIILLCLILFYTLALTVAFALQSDGFGRRSTNAVAVLEEEGNYRWPARIAGYGRLDNFTDRAMIGIHAQRRNDMSPLENALSIGHGRYWSGYMIVLRPLLMVFEYITIRYINIFHMFLLLFLISIILQKRLNISYALLLAFILSTWNVQIFPYSVQYSSVFYVMMYSITFILWREEKLVCDNKQVVLLFLIIGSFVNFVDLLTFPLVTLGIPLVLCYSLRQKYSDTTIKSNSIFILLASGYWAAGYAITWASKWVLAGVVRWFTSDREASVSLFKSIYNQIVFRMVGNEDYPLSFTRMLQLNFNAMYPRILIIMIFVLLFIIILLLLKKHKPIKYMIKTSPILVLCVLPYVWFLVFANHSEIHFWFTYRIQAVTIFTLFSYLFSCFPDNMNIMRIDFWKTNNTESES